MTRSEGGYVIKINGRKVLGSFYGFTIEDVIKDAKRVSDAGDEVKVYVEMIRDDLDVIDYGNPDHVELKLLHTVGEEADEITVDTPEAALTLALKLAITAKTSEQAADCVQIAEQIASSMTLKSINICKMAAQAAVEYEETYQ
tara:strand:+ start:1091 stop:1519 length:429 start_codon:yes stop_codon:yes gene_type:complete